MDLSQPNNYSYSVTQWGIIGDATPGGWAADTDMTIIGGTDKWTVTACGSVVVIKFRANDAWDINYGDDGADLSLEAGGANLVIGAAGNYTITMNLATLTYTIVLN